MISTNNNYKRLKSACYMTNISMSVVGNISAILFLTFRSLYGISYTRLGFLVLINFFTQLSVDLLFSFFSHKFNIKKALFSTPLFVITGLLIYSVMPFLLPQSTYIWLIIGTLLFSAGAGLSEVLTSPVIAAIPAENPDKELSRLHSVYAWGVVAVIMFSTLFLAAFGSKYWHILILILTAVPIIAFILFFGSRLPEMAKPEKTSTAIGFMKNKMLWVCVLIIFFGGASEVTMAQWSSGFLEQGLGIPKVLGDIFGVALFSVMLGTGRTLYSKIGRNVTKVLLLGTIGAAICYLTAAFCNIPIVGMLACALTGLCVSMLWPGSLIAAADFFPEGGVLLYALMAAGGDLGASVAPQLIGVITDAAIGNSVAVNLAEALSLTTEQLGMRLGMLIGALFPIISIPLYAYCHKKLIQNKK